MPDKERENQYYVDIVKGLAERTIKRIWIAWILTILLLVCSWVAFFWYENQYTTESIDITQENEDGYNNYIGNDGDINYGYTENPD